MYKKYLGRDVCNKFINFLRDCRQIKDDNSRMIYNGSYFIYMYISQSRLNP